MQPTSLSVEHGPTPPKAALHLWGAQSERPLPCNTEVVAGSSSDAIWQQPSSSSPSLTFGTADGGTNVESSAAEIASLRKRDTFKLLLQQLESEHDREVCQLRAELENQQAGARQGVEANMLGSALTLTACNQSDKTCDRANLNEQVDASAALPQGDVPKQISASSTFYSAVGYEIEKQHVDEVIGSKKTNSFLKRMIRGPSNPSAFRKFLARVEDSQAFDGICAIVIMLNTILLAIATDSAARNANPYRLPRFFKYTDLLFSVWFLSELALRMLAHGICCFFFGEDWTWNLFDFIVVAADFTEVVFASFSGKTEYLIYNLSAVRMLRVLRVVRTVRVIRLVRFFKELRMMVFSILKSGVVLLWSFSLVCIVIFMFSMYLTQSVTFFIYEDKRAGIELIEKLQYRFGSLVYVGYILFQCITGGLSWGELSDDLLEVHWSNGLVLCFYIFFQLFAVMNVVAGIFVETAFRCAHEDRHEVIQEAVYTEQVAALRMQTFLEETDMDHNGTITLKELKQHLEIPNMRLQLKQLGIEVTDATSIFRLLDRDKRGELKVRDFVFGCLQMQGSARSIDLITLMHETRQLKSELQRVSTLVQDSFLQQQHIQDKLELLLVP